MFTDIIDEMITELIMADDREIFNFPNYTFKPDNKDEDLWSPKRLPSSVFLQPSLNYNRPRPNNTNKPSETFLMTAPSFKIFFEVEQNIRVPVLVITVSSLPLYLQCLHIVVFLMR